MTNDLTEDPHDEPSTEDGRGFPRWLKWGLLGALAILVLGYGAILIYANFINDPAEELDEDDLAAALEGTSADGGTEDAGGVTGDDATDDTATQTTNPATDEAADDTSDATSDDTAETIDEDDLDEVLTTDGAADTVGEPATTEPPAATDTPGAASDTWEVTDASELGYRVKEILFGVDTEGVGRTDEIDGALTIDGTRVTEAEFVVDVASIESDDSRRDNQFRGRIMSTDEFPTATFTLTEPIELGTEAVEGAAVETTATGELTLRGVTNPVTFDVSARLENDRIGVLGNIPVVFADYGIANPSTGGITTEDEGLLEFVLVFERA